MKMKILEQTKPIAIGDVLFTDAYKVGAAKSFLQRAVLPKVQLLIDKYSELGLQPFSQKLWSAIVDARGAEPIETLYSKATEKELSSIPLLKTAQNAAIAEQMKAIATAYKDAFEATFTNSDPQQLPFSLDVISIDKGGSPFVDEQQIIDRFSTRIENENQLKFYTLAEKMVEVSKEMQSLLQDNGIWSQTNWISDLQTHGIFDTDVNNTLTANPVFIAAIP